MKAKTQEHKGNICCEGCFRLGKKEGRQEEVEELIELINKRIIVLKKEMKQYKKPEVNEFYARINELKELKKAGGLK